MAFPVNPVRFFTACAVALTLGTLWGEASAQTPIVHKMQLRTATVFLRGAELFSTGQVSLPAGESEVILTQVARDISLPSLMISTDSGVTVQSAKPQNDYLEEDRVSPKAQEIKDQIQKVERQRGEWLIQKKVAEEQLFIMADNRKLATDKNSGAAEVAKMLDLVEKRMASALSRHMMVNEKLSILDEAVAKLTRQLNEETTKNFSPGGQIVVKLYTPRATTSKIGLSYVVTEAGWSPVYDFRVQKTDQPVNLVYRALLRQQSGIDWKNVRLTLSTGNPGQGTQAPMLSPAFLRMPAPPRTPRAAVPYASEPQGSSAVVSEQRSAEKPVRIQQGTLDNFVVTNSQGINTSFDISLPYSIPADGKTHVVLIKSTDLDSTYRYVSSPKLDEGAFLQSEINNWETLTILPGKTSIYFENAFVGEGYIDPQQRRGQSLAIGLGRDNQVFVRRETDQNFKNKSAFFGNRITQQYAYTITAKNTRNEALTLDVFDQIPVSTDSEILVEDQKYEGATYTATTGELKWTLSLGAREEKKISFSYSVSYPKDKPVSGL